MVFGDVCMLMKSVKISLFSWEHDLGCKMRDVRSKKLYARSKRQEVRREMQDVRKNGISKIIHLSMIDVSLLASIVSRFTSDVSLLASRVSRLTLLSPPWGEVLPLSWKYRRRPLLRQRRRHLCMLPAFLRPWWRCLPP